MSDETKNMEITDDDLDVVVGGTGMTADDLVYKGKSKLKASSAVKKGKTPKAGNLVYNQSSGDLMSGDVLSKGTMC